MDMNNEAVDNSQQTEAEQNSAEGACECAANAQSDLAKELEAATLNLKQLQDELDSAKEDYLRAQAEVQNMRRRCEQDVDKAKKFAVDRFVKDLLPALDPIEKALQFIDREKEETKSLVQGVESTFALLVKALNVNGVQVIDPQNDVFDPNLHQAIQSLENPDVPANHVMAVVQKGYQLNGRVLRPAMVIVSKGTGSSVDAQA